MDVVITFHPKDRDTLENCLFGLINNVNNVRNIYLVTGEDPKISGYKNLFWIPENKYPFSFNDVKEVLNLPRESRVGWYYQQILKLYCFTVIPTLSENFLILDSDLIFTKPIQFFHENKLCYTFGHEPLHPSYISFLNKILPNLDKSKLSISGIAHHMIFNKSILIELISLIEKIHNNIFWKIFLSNRGYLDDCGCSEYELYFHYINQYHPDKIYLRKLSMLDSRTIVVNNFNYDMVGCHRHLR
jgi:hypothetical protein